jgi:type IV pilus assembly protein PilC
MATATVQRRAQIRDVRNTPTCGGTDRNNRQVRGEMRAASRRSSRRRCGAGHTDCEAPPPSFRGARQRKDITFFTRQLATMLKAGVPLLQAFEIVARGHSNARFARLMMNIKGRVEAGSSLSQPSRVSGALRCAVRNLVHAGETAGMLDGILERLATYKKDPGDQEQDQIRPVLSISVVVVAIVVIWVIMIWVILRSIGVRKLWS